MHTTQQDGNKSHGAGKSNTYVNTSLVKTMAALDEFKCGFPSEGLSTVTSKWWGNSSVGQDGSNGDAKSLDEDDMKQDGTVNDKVASERPSSLVAVRKRIAEEGREAVKHGLHRGFGSEELNRRDQALLSQIFKSSLPKDWVTGSS